MVVTANMQVFWLEWVVPLPKGLSLRESMILGTAGFTAGKSIFVLEEQGMDAANGPILIRGASGGLGGMAIKMLKNLNYITIAESRKKDTESDFLHSLGAMTRSLVQMKDSYLKSSL